MKKIITLCLSLLWIAPFGLMGQFSLELKPVTWQDAPGAHSFVAGMHNGKWLIMGGRVDGLHLRRPVDSFLADDNNKEIIVVDPVQKQHWTAPITTLPTAIQEQIQSTNMEFEQRGDMLYIIGGYGYSSTAADHITYPNLLAVDVPGLMDAVMNNQPISGFFRQITDTRLQVTGGYLDLLDSTFYLVGGQNFEGRYNPHGPTHGPGFFQEYTNEIRKFSIQDNGTTLAISNYTALRDTANLHRRDYNMSAQIFPNGQIGFTAFSGVFQHNVDLPWLNTVDIDPSGYTVNNNFNQYLSQYHSAHVAMFDSTANEMHTLFFGGMSRYSLDTTTGALVDDPDVPFVKTISRVTRFPNGSMDEFKLSIEMPEFLGAGAEFFPHPNAPFDGMDILHLNQLGAGASHIGYIWGGIESDAENIFFVNDGTQSRAHTTLYEVWLNPNPTSRDQDYQVENEPVSLEIFPNPARKNVNIRLNSRVKGKVIISLTDIQGREINILLKERITPGERTIPLDTSNLTPGIYFVRIQAGSFSYSEKLVISPD